MQSNTDLVHLYTSCIPGGLRTLDQQISWRNLNRTQIPSSIKKMTEAASLRERCIQINQHLVSNCLSDKPYKNSGNDSSCAMRTGDV